MTLENLFSIILIIMPCGRMTEKQKARLVKKHRKGMNPNMKTGFNK